MGEWVVVGSLLGGMGRRVRNGGPLCDPWGVLAHGAGQGGRRPAGSLAGDVRDMIVTCTGIWL